MNRSFVYTFFITLIIIILVLWGYDALLGKQRIDDGVDEDISTLKVKIDNKDYILNLEKNETTKYFIKMLPKTFKMSDLNYNEKYIYLDETLPKNEKKVRSIIAGDVMLFGDNCLVIFYKSFDTVYSYTKIGHINNIEELKSDDVTVIITK